MEIEMKKGKAELLWVQNPAFADLHEVWVAGQRVGWIHKRPEYCDRGHWQAEVEIVGADSADAFPRFFMSFAVAKQEMEDFLRWRIWKQQYPGERRSWDDIEAENTRLRAALAQSELPCVYCSLPVTEWAKCSRGFPGCARGDDLMGCPELGAMQELEAVKEELEEAKARLSQFISNEVWESHLQATRPLKKEK